MFEVRTFMPRDRVADALLPARTARGRQGETDVMKNERLDQILTRLGLVSEADIQQALQRQQARGGRIGSHLVALGHVTQEQLAEALAERYGVPAYDPDVHEIDPDTVAKLPLTVAEKFMAIAIDLERSGTLRLAVANPENRELVDVAKKATGAKRIIQCVAAEATIKNLLQQFYPAAAIETDRVSELPELFDDSGRKTPRRSRGGANEERRVLLVGKSGYLTNLLGPAFEREGYKLHLATSLDEVEKILNSEPIHYLLVAENDVERFSEWLRKGGFQLNQMELSSYGNVGTTLLQNPVPYRRVVRSLMRSLQIIAETRCMSAGWLPPYVLICNDIHNLARTFGIRRIATDGLQVASYLLVPVGTAGSKEKRSALSFVDFDKSLEHAKSLHFPWDVEGVLCALRDYLSGGLGGNGDRTAEISLAAQIMAIVWYRRVAFSQVEGSTEEAVAKIKNGLKKQAGSLASREVVEAYIRQLDRNKENRQAESFDQILIVSRQKTLAKKFEGRLNAAAGFNCVIVGDLAEARSLCERQPPAALLIHHESFPDEMSRASRDFKFNSAVLLYAVTKKTDSSVILDLLDVGFDDVFSPPYDFDVIAARISKSVRGLSQKARGTEKPGSFSAHFKAFAFIDLVQTLGQSVKSVHVSIRGTSGETADVYLRKGKLVRAICGKLAGVEAIYHVIAWGENGSFAVEPEEQFPPDNIFESNEAILMEGCRLLDESTVKK